SFKSGSQHFAKSLHFGETEALRPTLAATEASMRFLYKALAEASQAACQLLFSPPPFTDSKINKECEKKKKVYGSSFREMLFHLQGKVRIPYGTIYWSVPSI
ncbi:unnamed protein product, partial [Ixodes persulcatus]